MKKKYIALIIVIVAALVAVPLLTGGKPANTADVKKFIRSKGVDNIAFADFDYLPHKDVPQASTIIVDYQLSDGNRLRLCGLDEKTPFSIIIIDQNGKEETLKPAN